ncbi:MAG TPA: SMC-Scp complex subunit ScpB [Micrococcales bacterium]|uniref:SMC-Scp complex subunit ScpB n=1 Tax=Miniimonas arenae TaxID=676201 RepID=A0A5C5BGY9_9MICO|nr:MULTISPECIES: SMC-Scp complex subunit ScpB [Miniimonas]TNU77060.1 SMC-Scp complex subunit ScpB [Miniimonas arenae]HCX84722.1 SMC-Scp complex subunit ScpB [Micrococcales bacterium]
MDDHPALADLPGGELAAVEAILAVVDEPVPAARVAGALGLTVERTEALLHELAARYRGETADGAEAERPRGYVLRETGGAWRLYSAPAFAPYVQAFVIDGQTARLTQASLETLAVVAYRQPVTRGRIAAIRGVNVDGVVRTLTTRGLIEEAGRDGEGGAILYRTTTHFLERMGLSSLADLPPLAPYLPGDADLAELEEEVR